MKGIVYNNIKTFILYNKHEIKIIMYKSLYINKREIVDIINKMQNATCKSNSVVQSFVKTVVILLCYVNFQILYP